MSVDRTESIDAAGVRDGWFVVSIHQLDDWDSIDDPASTFRKKLATAFAYLESSHTLARACLLPAKVTLESSDPVPEDVREMCAQHGVEILEGSLD